MKKVEPDDLRPEYRRKDLGKGVRGRFLKEYESGTNLVPLDEDVAAVFPTGEEVNAALRTLIGVAERCVRAEPGATTQPRRKPSRS